MAFLSGEPSHVRNENGSYDKEETDKSGGSWYLYRKEIEENSPSRKDGIDLKKETYLRKSYCTFLQDLGMRLKVPQVTIATAIIFCHRFFLHQSHAKNDRRTIATVCMFLAGKVEETPRPLKDVIIVSYEIIHKKDPSAIQKIKQKEVYEQQKELILLGERIVLTTIGFDFNVHHPYKPLVEAIKKFKVAQNALAQVAWNFVNDGLRTSLCLQYKPHLIAAGAIFLAAKFLKVKLPSDGERVWWQEFDVTPRQLEDVSNQMLELYEQNRTGQSSLTNEVEGNIGGVNQPANLASTVSQSSISVNGSSSNAGTANTMQGPITTSACPSGSLSHADTKLVGTQIVQKHSDRSVSSDNKKGGLDCNTNEGRDHSVHELEKNSDYCRNTTETSKGDISNKPANIVEAKEWHDDGQDFTSSSTGNQISNSDEVAEELSPPDAITKIDRNKVKAALEKTRRLRNNVAKRNDIMDDDDLIERELENGIELPTEHGNLKQGKYRDCSKQLYRQELDGEFFEQENGRDMKNIRLTGQQYLLGDARPGASNSEHDGDHEVGFENAEEGELSSLDEQEFPSPKYHSKVANSKRSTELSGAGRPDGLKRNRDDYESSKPVNERVLGSGRQSEQMQQHDTSQYSHDAPGPGGLGYPERDYRKRHATHG